MKQTGLIFLFLIASIRLLAGTVKGHITDQQTGEPVTGAIVVLENGNVSDVTGLDGSFKLEHISDGSYTLKISYVSYKTFTQTVKISGDESVVVNTVLMPDAKSVLKNVTIAAKKNGASDKTARTMEHDADQVLNILSGHAIQISPDLTVANAMQRISGITIERNSNGDGQYALVRGMDKRYNYTLVNGVKIPSPDDKYRYVPLDIFPSDLIERLEVYKALTPSMEGDAIGGAVNIVMKDAPDHLYVTGNVASGYNQLFMDRDFMSYDYHGVNKQSPYEQFGNKYSASASDFPSSTVDYNQSKPSPNLLASVAIGNRFFNNRFGVIVAGSMQHTYRGSNSLFYSYDKVDTFKGVTLTNMSERYYSDQQKRYGVHAKMDYHFNDRNKLQWYNAYLSFTNIQVRDVTSTQLTIGGYDPELGNATLNYSTRSRITTQKILNSTLKGEHLLRSNLKLDWSAVASKASNDAPDNTTISLYGTEQNFVQTKTMVNNETRRWDHNSDRDLAGYFNFTYNKALLGLPVEWKLGGLYRDKARTNFYNNYQLMPVNQNAMYGVDFTDYTQIQWRVENPRGSVATSLNYDATEQTAAGYLQFKVQQRKLEVVGGVRVENNNQGYSMQFPIGEDRPTGNQITTDVLPSLHFKYMPNGKTNIRASYFRSVNRPGFFEIVPYKVVNEDYQERGNPDLKRAIADNIDLRYELFPRASEQFMVGTFYKRIQNPIEFTLQPDAVRGQDIYYAPGNFGTATNYGLEIDFIKYFSKFGIKANYTYTHSSITTPKSQRIRNEQGDLQTITVDETRPLYGQAAHVANLSLLYTDGKKGWDAQLACSYVGPRINTVSQFYGDDLWQTGFVTLDCSVEKTFHKRFSVFAKVNNILNTPSKVYIKNSSSRNDGVPNQDKAGQTLIQSDYYQRSYLLGVRFKL
ncbi:TonB-dependent receptor [Taibaiella soli]|uniref:TonB-dependent receptor n=1 Tax=Taibaiella soli TaxID=1649169 RepID=A0A2W2BCS1_9BACT|nr:TonB-dependent receptor [Taibaiella soli]PZF74029.1 TonB-dependent receptor [Taibaiella soli]